jgi:hypothetical protein
MAQRRYLFTSINMATPDWEGARATLIILFSALGQLGDSSYFSMGNEFQKKEVLTEHPKCKKS